MLEITIVIQHGAMAAVQVEVRVIFYVQIIKLFYFRTMKNYLKTIRLSFVVPYTSLVRMQHFVITNSLIFRLNDGIT